MSDTPTPTPETYAINILLENLDEWIDDALENSKPIGLTLFHARRTIVEQRARITELWDALGMVSRQRDRMEEELNEALKERDEARSELARVRKELVASNRGAETNSKVNQGLCARLAEAERERDELLQRLSVWESAASRMKKQLSFALPFHQGMDSQEEA